MSLILSYNFLPLNEAEWHSWAVLLANFKLHQTFTRSYQFWLSSVLIWSAGSVILCGARHYYQICHVREPYCYPKLSGPLPPSTPNMAIEVLLTAWLKIRLPSTFKQLDFLTKVVTFIPGGKKKSLFLSLKSVRGVYCLP